MPVAQVVLVLSPRTAEAVRTALYPARDAAELDSFDNEANTLTSALLAGVIVEITDQLGNVPAPAQEIAQKMATAAAKALSEETPEQRRTRILWAQDAKP